MISNNRLVAFMGLILGMTSYVALHSCHFPEKICVGSIFLSVLVVAVFWSAIMIGTEDDEDN